MYSSLLNENILTVDSVIINGDIIGLTGTYTNIITDNLYSDYISCIGITGSTAIFNKISSNLFPIS